MSSFFAFLRQHILASLLLAVGSVLAIASKIMEAIDYIRLGLPLIWWHAIGLGLFFIGIVAILYKWHLAHSSNPTSPDQSRTPTAPESGGAIAAPPAAPSDSPLGQKPAVDKQAYNELVEFSLDCLLPACEAQMDLQDTIVRRICSNAEVLYFVLGGMRTDYKTQEFYEKYSELSSGIAETSGYIIEFDAMIDCIDVIEKKYKQFCEQANYLIKSTNIDYRKDDKLGSVWEIWRTKHNALVDAYEAIKRDSRFPKLFRPGRESRWGNKVPSFPPRI